MLLRPRELEAIREGRIDLAFRRWDRPRLRAGTKMRTAIGLVEAVSVFEVDVDAITEDDARRAGASSRAELVELLSRRRPGDPVWRVELRYAGEDPRVALRASSALDSADRSALGARLDRMDARSSRGPWTRATLELVRERPEVRAADLAESVGVELQVFKRDVRKLKELGLTESLEVGYRISPRGRAFLDG